MPTPIPSGSISEFRSGKRGQFNLVNPVRVTPAPFSPLLVLRWYNAPLGGVIVTRTLNVAHQQICHVTRSEPYEFEWLDTFNNKTHRVFSAEASHMEDWEGTFFEPFRELFEMFMHGPSNGGAK